jgi:hypothetical protein
MRYLKLTLFCLIFAVCASCVSFAAEDTDALFPTIESKEDFARDMSTMIEKAWIKWQDSVLVDDIDVESSYGILREGDLKGPVLTAPAIMSFLDRKGRSQDYIDCVKAVAESVENGMRKWQIGYINNDIPFPQGASCTYTLPPCNNMPVMLVSGSSSGDRYMSEDKLYNFMLYRTPGEGRSTLEVLHAAAGAISYCFDRWKNSCSIVGILASGGIAPQPSPMGQGPGPVKGAKGNGGKLVGAYFSGGLMYKRMVRSFRENEGEDLALEF